MKDDERLLLETLAKVDHPYVRVVVRELGMNEKRAAYICDKWEGKGWYDYGVSVLAGWLTDEGRAIVGAGPAKPREVKPLPSTKDICERMAKQMAPHLRLTGADGKELAADHPIRRLFEEALPVNIEVEMRRQEDLLLYGNHQALAPRGLLRWKGEPTV